MPGNFKEILKRIIPENIRFAMRCVQAELMFLPARLKYRSKVPHILSEEETLRTIIAEHLSVSRYGDGELNIMEGEGNDFCTPDTWLAGRLRELMNNPPEKLLICVPGALKSTAGYDSEAAYFWNKHLRVRLAAWQRNLPHTLLGNSFCTRLWIVKLNRSLTLRLLDLWKQVWEGRKLLIVEGEGSRLGVGNDLFYNAASVERIICPAKDAYLRYSEILASAKAHNPGGSKLVLIALGQTATLLAADLAHEGMQAIDIGHIDVEYLWFLSGTRTKKPIPGRAVNEVTGTYFTPISDPIYTSQIIDRILP